MPQDPRVKPPLEIMSQKLQSPAYRLLSAILQLLSVGIAIIAVYVPNPTTRSQLQSWYVIAIVILTVVATTVFNVAWIAQVVWRKLSDSAQKRIDEVQKAVTDHVDTKTADLESKLKGYAEKLQDEMEKRLPPPRDQTTEWENAYKFSAKRYGLGYDEMLIFVSIDKDGGATCLRHITVKAYTTLEKLDQSLLIPEKDPEGKPRVIDIDDLKVEKGRTGREVSLGAIHQLDGQLIVEIVFTPTVYKDQIVDFRLTEPLPARLFAIDMTHEEIEKRETRLDYVGWHIDRPTSSLQITVRFPVGHRPSGYGHEVRYARIFKGIEKIRRQPDEENRLAGRLKLTKLDDGAYELVLPVDYPMVGLIYMIGWKPFEKNAPPTV
ncbi:MAG: hypothetical protein IT330_15230 [Anaerolineae bacterium]|nr:hypothetical protein [Anaerolineae bacterium]